MRIIALDPSGNFKEGMGTTGIAIYHNTGQYELDDICASDFNHETQYWDAHIHLLEWLKPDEFVMEGFKLYGHKSKEQINSELETPQLIGCIKLWCFQNNIPLTIQFASEVKSRWSEDVMVASGILEHKGNKYLFNGKPTNQHQRDALKHLLHFMRYKMEGK